jgi:hypothetical protein
MLTWVCVSHDSRYFYRSQTDYGVVDNSPEAAANDEAVLEAELDLNKLKLTSDADSNIEDSR